MNTCKNCNKTTDGGGCYTNGDGYISKSLVRRLQAQGGTLLFSEQAQSFLKQAQARKRNPIRPATARTYQSQIETHLIPAIGEIPLEDVGNAVVKSLITHLTDKGLKPASINLIFNLIKQIRASAVNENGEQLFPYTWNSEFVDLPVVDVSKQKRPTVSAQTVSDTIYQATGSYRALVAILAGSGLRIAEALALTHGPDDGKSTVWIPEESKIIVRQQRIGNVFADPKTKAGIREVDLSAKLNDFISKHTASQPGQLMFPESETWIRIATGQIGFHAFRRFRETWLEQNNTPRMLMKFWTGHAASDITERYIKVGSEIELRKKEAERVGLGFELPLSVSSKL